MGFVKNGLKGIIETTGKLLGFEFPEEKYNDNLLGVKEDPSQFIGVVYGVTRKSGVRIGTFVRTKKVGGSTHRYLYAVYALSHGEVEHISNPRMDGISLDDSKIKKFTKWSWGVGNLTQNATTNSLIQEILTYDKPNASDPTWDAVNGKLGGVAFGVVRLRGDKEDMNSLGVITWDIKGVKVYDDRISQTVWSDNPALCLADYATNPIYGKGLNRQSQVNITSVIAAANYFDEVAINVEPTSVSSCTVTALGKARGYILVPKYVYDEVRAGLQYAVTGFTNTNDNFTGTLMSKGSFRNKNNSSWDLEDGQLYDAEAGQFALYFAEFKNSSQPDGLVTLTFNPGTKRYTCNGNVDTSKTVFSNIKFLATAFNGYAGHDSQGRFTVIPDKVDPVIMTFTSDIIVGDISIDLPKKENRFNKITATWRNPDNGYEEASEVVSSSIFLSRDKGEELSTTINLEFCNNYLQAERISTIELNKSRHGEVISFKTFWSTLKCSAGNVVAIEHPEMGWPAGKKFRILSIGIPDIYNEVSLTLVEYFDEDYIPSVINARARHEGIFALDLQDLPPVTNVLYTPLYGHPSVSGKISWDAPLDHKPLSYIVVVGQLSGTTLVESFRYTSVTDLSIGVDKLLTAGQDYTIRIMWIDYASRLIPSLAEHTFTKLAMPAPTDIVIINESPWAITAYPGYIEQYTGQEELKHKWFLAEFTGSEPTFASAEHISTASELNYSGLTPGAEYRLWVQAFDDFGESTVYPIGNGEPFTAKQNVALEYYYINYPNGTALKNGVGTLVVEAHKVSLGVDSILTGTPADPQLYDGASPIGYSASFTAAQINGSKVITFKDGVDVLDSVTLLDVTDGSAGVVGVVSTDGELSWVREVNEGAWIPASTTRILTFDFYDLGIVIASREITVTRSPTGTLSGATTATSGDATSVSFSGTNTTAFTVVVTHDDSGAKATESLVSVKSGSDGATLYTWIKYGTDATGTGITDNPAGMSYVGISYNNTEQNESGDPVDYSWSKLEGDAGADGASAWYKWVGTQLFIKVQVGSPGAGWYQDTGTGVELKGDQGPQGVAGAPGANGQTFYTWIKYSANANGNPIQHNPDGTTKYIGISPNRTTASESGNYWDYEWSKITGEDGNPGTVGADGVTYYTWIKYSDYIDGTSPYDTPNANTLYIGIAPNKTVPDESTNKFDYTWSKFKGDDGAIGGTGATGIPGEPGDNALVIGPSSGADDLIKNVLTNITQLTCTKTGTFKVVANGAVSGFKISGTTNPTGHVYVYRGGTQLSTLSSTGASFSKQITYNNTLALTNGEIFYVKAQVTAPTATSIDGQGTGNITMIEVL